MPGVRPVHVYVVKAGVVIGIMLTHSGYLAPPSVEALTTYLMIADPPSSTGGVHDTVIDVDVAFDPTTPVGAPGTPVA